MATDARPGQSADRHAQGSDPDALCRRASGAGPGRRSRAPQLDEILDNVDHRLADSLAHAGNAADDRARDAELANAKSILTEYIGYPKGEPLVAHMDQAVEGEDRPELLLISGLTTAAKAIG
jgi:hypothetical protein